MLSYVTKTDDTVEKRTLIKGTQSNEYIVSINFKDKMQVPTALLLF